MLDVSEVLVAVVATAFPPFVGWAANRLFAESRLVSRLARLGAVYAGIPDSPEKEQFGEHLTALRAKLNERLRHETVVLRHWRWARCKPARRRYRTGGSAPPRRSSHSWWSRRPRAIANRITKTSTSAMTAKPTTYKRTGRIRNKGLLIICTSFRIRASVRGALVGG